MLKEWQFNVLFFVGVGGAVFLVLGPLFGVDVEQNPTALTGLGAILTYVLTQRNSWTKHNKEHKQRSDEGDEDERE